MTQLSSTEFKVRNSALILCLTIFCIFFNGNREAKGQTWIKPGQSWEYYVEWFGAPKLMLKYAYTDDTLYHGHFCQRIKRYQREIDNLPVIGQEVQIGEVYTYNDGGKVFYFVEGEFHMMFDMDAQPGDSWFLFEQEWNAGDGCDSSVVIVDSIGTLPYGDKMLKWISVHPTGGGNIAIRGKVIEGFGAIGHFFLYTSYSCSGNNDSYINRPMCYSDPESGVLQYIVNTPGNFLPGPKCDFFEVGIEEKREDHISIFPQPAADRLNIHKKDNQFCSFVIYDLQGKELIQRQFSGTDYSMEISDLSAGVYFIKLKQGGNISTKKVLINE